MGAPPPTAWKRKSSPLPPDGYPDRVRSAYATRETPWDIGVPAPELVRVLDADLLRGKTFLEIGCGTGTNSIELARRGYRVTAVDLVDLALEQGKEKAKKAKVEIDFRLGDFTKLELGGPFDCVVDVSVYDGIRTRNLAGFLEALRRASRTGTRWLSLAGSATDPLPNGPPMVTEAEFRAELEPMFTILDAHEFRYSLASGFEPLFWSILMERR